MRQNLGQGGPPRAGQEGRSPWALVRRGDAAVPGGGGRAGTEGGWWLFEEPVEVLSAPPPRGGPESGCPAVPKLLERVEEAAAGGLWAVGFVSYEAAPAFDGAFQTHPAPAGVPAAWFALFPEPKTVETLPVAPGGDRPLVRDLEPSVDDERYLEAVRQVQSRIASGETYQANLTYRLRGRLAEAGTSPFALFRRLVGEAPPAYAAYLELGRAPGVARGAGATPAAVCCASPELFFEREGPRLLCRPMKGTAPRGRTVSEDLSAAAALRSSAKERAENLMIVDMVRNDLGRIARPGTVRVLDLFRVERYPTLFQMTSEVEATTDAGLAETFRALFPCASITGAPKVRTMEILTELEEGARGVYTGAVGYVAPGARARFAVAIRTAWVGAGSGGADGNGAPVEYGTGGGVVWDSVPREELAETRTKALVLGTALGSAEPPARLLETLLWRPEKGYLLLDRHLDRLLDSAVYFGFLVDRGEVAGRLERAAGRLAASAAGPSRVRLLVDRCGRVEVEAAPFAPCDRPWRVTPALEPVDERDPYLFHKTTRREVYEHARRSAPECDDVILWNRAGELTESTVANLVVQIDGVFVTPDARCGLLPGTLRAELLEQGLLTEARLDRDDLARAEGLWLINSVRGWIPTTLVGDRPVESRPAGAAALGPGDRPTAGARSGPRIGLPPEPAR